MLGCCQRAAGRGTRFPATPVRYGRWPSASSTAVPWWCPAAQTAPSVQANRQLFTSGAEDHPANLVYSLDPAMDRTPGRLTTIAEALFSLKGKPQPDRAHQTIADNLAAEREPTVRIPVPYALAGARHVYLTSVIVVRHHLPVDHLRRRLLPLLVDPERTTATMVLPSRYWPKTLVAPWLTDARQG